MADTSEIAAADKAAGLAVTPVRALVPAMRLEAAVLALTFPG